MDFVVKESGVRNVAYAYYRGHRVEVISERRGRSLAAGATLHAFVQRVSDARERIGGFERIHCANILGSVEMAFAEGFRAAEIHLDNLAGDR